MDHLENPALVVAWLGFFLALIFGYMANKTSFCTMGAVSDVVNMGDWGRMRAWLLGIGLAILGTNLLVYFGYLDVAQTYYTRGTLHWFAALIGGLTFGVGMTLAGGCGQRTLVRLGGGNLKSVVVFMFLGYTALVTMNGVLRVFVDGVLRAEPFTVHVDGLQTLPSLLGMADKFSQFSVGLILALLILAFVFSSKDFRESRDNIIAGLVVGLVVVAGWYVTGHLGFGENPETMELTYQGVEKRPYAFGHYRPPRQNFSSRPQYQPGNLISGAFSASNRAFIRLSANSRRNSPYAVDKRQPKIVAMRVRL